MSPVPKIFQETKIEKQEVKILSPPEVFEIEEVHPPTSKKVALTFEAIEESDAAQTKRKSSKVLDIEEVVEDGKRKRSSS